MHHDLSDLRQSLDTIDEAVLLLLAERFRVTQMVGEYKKYHKLPAVDKAREERQFTKIRGRATDLGVDPDLACDILRLIIDKVVENHKLLMTDTIQQSAVSSS